MFPQCSAKIVVYAGMSMPWILSTLDPHPHTIQADHRRASKSRGKLLAYLFIDNKSNFEFIPHDFAKQDHEHNVVAICRARGLEGCAIK